MDTILNFLYKKKIIVLISLFVLVVVIILSTILFKPEEEMPVESENSIQLILFGAEKVSIYVGEEYQEPGYYAVDTDGNILTSLVKVSSSLDNQVLGFYTITYQIEDIKKSRIIEVIDNDEEEGVLTLSLVGENVVNLSINSDYEELGCIAKYNDLDLTDQVLITGSVDADVAGIYTITYSLTYNGVNKEIIRTVIVVDDELKITLTPDKTSYTNSSVVVKVVVSGNDFSSLVLPNKVVVNNKQSSYTITENGTYTFLVYNNSYDVFEEKITISNIDKTAPSGTCVATISPASTKISVVATDTLSGIKNYEYFDNSTQLISTVSSTYNYSKKTSKTVRVKIYDNASNQATITCQVIDNSALPAILPSSSENIVKQGESDTLKVYITKKGEYYITRVWAYEPYQQLNKFDSPEYGKNLYRPKKLLEMARDKYNLTNQLLVGFNASGFYLKGTYDADSVSKYSSYNKTSVGTLVITNGQVIRNAYNKAYKTWFTIGVTPNNILQVYTDSKGTTTEAIEKHRIWANDVISSGIRNTFTFASPLVINGVRSSITTNMPSASSNKNRQAICQVNTNNFVLITGKNLTRNELIEIMLSLNCTTGVNLDGGGSIALLFKEKNQSTISTIIGNGRDLTEVGYFSE